MLLFFLILALCVALILWVKVNIFMINTLLVILIFTPMICFGQDQPRPIGLSGYLYGGQGVEQVTVSMKKYAIQDKYGTDVYGGELKLNLMKLIEKMFDKDIFGKWSLSYSMGKNYERDVKTYYNETTNKIGLGYSITPFLGVEVYYKEKEQDINLSGTNVNLGLDYIGVSLLWRL
jgi:hypothetical protein